MGLRDYTSETRDDECTYFNISMRRCGARRCGEKRVLYINTEELTNQMIVGHKLQQLNNWWLLIVTAAIAGFTVYGFASIFCAALGVLRLLIFAPADFFYATSNIQPV